MKTTTPHTSAHWNKVYQQKTNINHSWYQPHPTTGMQMVAALDLPLDAHIIDIGGGDSLFVDALLAKGYYNIYVLDISAQAIENAKHRLGQKAATVNWIVGDITAFTPAISFDLWYDRATFHFLTTAYEINRYVTIANAAVRKNGHMIIGTFGDDGPASCSGLPVKQYNEATLPSRFSGNFDALDCLKDLHCSPSGAIQPFLFCSFRRRQ